MANPVLLKSSLFLGFLNLLFVEIWNVPLLYRSYMWIGVSTSVLNHGMTNYYIKHLDRAMMFANSFGDVYYIFAVKNEFLLLKFICCILFCVAIGSFFQAKFMIFEHNSGKNEIGNKHHLMSHLFITIEHFFMSYYFMFLK